MGQGVDAVVSPVTDGLGDASDLQSQVKSLQKQIESMDASTLTEAVQKLNTDIQRITSRMRASLVSAEAAVAGLLPAGSSSQDYGGAAAAPPSSGETQSVKMSADVVDSNPYSRLMALQKMGVVKNYQKIRSCTVAVVGVGGLGSGAAEMLTRCGVGCLLLYDYDSVKPCNLNRMFYRPQQVGMAKTEAAAASLAEINPDVQVETFNMNITTVKGFQDFRSSLTNQDTGKSRIDFLLSCVDNYEARVHINRICLELQQDWMESGVSEDAMSGHIQMISPGHTACFECAPPLAVASGLDESTLQRQDVCSASLPTTMSIISGLLVQNALKALLDFGEVSQCIGYTSMSDYFSRERLRPNPECSQPECMQLQQSIRKNTRLSNVDSHSPLATDDPNIVLHEDNDWSICVIARSSQSERDTLVMPVDDRSIAVSDRTVGDLMVELKDSQNC